MPDVEIPQLTRRGVGVTANCVFCPQVHQLTVVRVQEALAHVTISAACTWDAHITLPN